MAKSCESSGRVTGKPPIEIESEERNSHTRIADNTSTDKPTLMLADPCWKVTSADDFIVDGKGDLIWTNERCLENRRAPPERPW